MIWRLGEASQDKGFITELLSDEFQWELHSLRQCRVMECLLAELQPVLLSTSQGLVMDLLSAEV